MFRSHSSRLSSCLGLLLLGTAMIPLAQASSPDAWNAFRHDVAAQCRAAAKQSRFETQAIQVDPFGSQNYGLARLVGHTEHGTGTQQVLCVYDKRTKQVEIGGPFAIENRRPQSDDRSVEPSP